MGNLFDGIKEAAYDIVSNTMGYDAFWTPSTGGPQQKTRVFFNDPQKTFKILKIDYAPLDWSMEYRSPFFGLLKTNVDQSKSETVTIESIVYNVTSVKAIHDGKTFLAMLQPV